MDLRQLEYFVRVAELGSFTRAAQALDIAQPALSRQVRLLEVELRQTLLLRNGRGATTTEAGKLLLEHGRGILHQVARAQDELARMRGGLAGRVALGLPPSVARQLTVPLTRAFRQRLPEARLSISEGLSVSLQERLLTGHIDIAVLYNQTATPGLALTPIGAQELALVEARPPGLPEDPPPPPLPLAEVAQRRLVIPSRPNAIRMVVETEMAAIACQPDVALEIDGVPAILDLVADGAGCAILPRHAVVKSTRPSDFNVRGILMPDGACLTIPLAAATSTLRPSTRSQQLALELIRDTLQTLQA